MKTCAAVLLVMSIASPSFAAVEFVNIQNAADIKWQMTDGVVYFRNFNDFDSAFLGCCYNYSLDTKTPAGKALWSMVVVKMVTSSPISIGVNNRASPSAVSFVGNH